VEVPPKKQKTFLTSVGGGDPAKKWR